MSVSVSLLKLVSVANTRPVWPEQFGALIAKLEEKPRERTHWGVIADWCQGEGEDELGAAFRWYMNHRDVLASYDRIQDKWALSNLPTSLNLFYFPNEISRDTPAGLMAGLARMLESARQKAQKQLEELA